MMTRINIFPLTPNINLAAIIPALEIPADAFYPIIEKFGPGYRVVFYRRRQAGRELDCPAGGQPAGRDTPVVLGGGFHTVDTAPELSDVQIQIHGPKGSESFDP